MTGLEEPEELWDRLQDVTADAQALAAANKKLTARVRLLERKLSEVGSLTDDELVAELPRRMTRALESAQGVANEILQRAKKQEAAIRQKAAESAAGIVKQAEAQAAELLNDAREQAAAHIAAAEAKALDVIGSAHARRKQVLAELEQEAGKVEQRISKLRKHESRLLHAYEVVERTLAEARSVLADPSPDRPSDPGSANPGRSNGAPAVRSGAKDPRSTGLRVYDWSPAASTAS